MKRVAFLFLISLCLVGVMPAKEAQPNEDPQIEQRMRHLTEQLRCLVCQNETLADSRADLAEDLRKQIREQIKAGQERSGNHRVSNLIATATSFFISRP
jgi:cytochrome c-type biogenesis protein CcmH